MLVMPFLAAALLACTVVDGDTLRCTSPGQGRNVERVRLIGIDAPELPGHCEGHRRCAPGDPWASKAALERLVSERLVQLDRQGVDHYGRTLAFARVGNIDLSCAQLAAGQAVYVRAWDVRGRIGDCP